MKRVRELFFIAGMLIGYFVLGGFYVYGKISQMEAELDD